MLQKKLNCRLKLPVLITFFNERSFIRTQESRDKEPPSQHEGQDTTL